MTNLLKSSYLCHGFIRQIHVQLEITSSIFSPNQQYNWGSSSKIKSTQILHILIQREKSPHVNTAYKIWNYMLFFQWSGSASYWLVYSLWVLEPFLMNIGCCNNFILSTDAGMLLIQLRSGCQWRLFASGCSKLIPAEMSFICFSNSGEKYWWEDSEL